MDSNKQKKSVDKLVSNILQLARETVGICLPEQELIARGIEIELIPSNFPDLSTIRDELDNINVDYDSILEFMLRNGFKPYLENMTMAYRLIYIKYVIISKVRKLM